MRIVYYSALEGTGDGYIKDDLLDALSASTGDTVMSEMSADELITLVQRQLYASSFIESPQENLIRTILINIREMALLEQIIFVLKNIDPLAKDVVLPRLVVISNFVTWSGKDYNGDVLNAEDLTKFLSRTPLHGYLSQYQLENTLLSLHKKGCDVCLVPLGMMYGGTGGHFKELFKILWGDKSSLQKDAEKSFELSLITAGRAPVMHKADVVKLLCALATFDKASGMSALPFLVPASDGYEWNLEDFLQNNSKLFNEIVGASMEPSCLISSSLVSLLPSFPAVKCNLSFQECSVIPLDYPKGLKEKLESIQSEFSTLNCLSPFRVMITGPPSSGKTECCNGLADLLQIPVVNIVSTVEYFINGEFEDMIKLRELLSTELEAIDTAGKKKGGDTFDLKTVNITESMASGLSKELLVKLIKCKVERDIMCSRRGYILDVWVSHFQTASGILSMFTPEKKPVESEPVEESKTGDVGGSESETKVISPTIVSENLDIIIELNCSEERNIQRWMLQNGQDVETQAAKLPKDLAGSFKTFEADMGSYNAKLTPIEEFKEESTEIEIVKNAISEGVNEGVEERKEVVPLKTHEEVAELSKYGAIIYRISTDDLSIEDVCKGLQTICMSKETSFGWIEKVNDNGVVAEVDTIGASEEAPQTATADETTGETKLREGSAEVIMATELTQEDNQFIMEECATYEKYSLDNILPDLTSLLVSIKREQPTDPLLEAINFLATKAATIEKQEEEKSREVFNSIIENSNREIVEKVKRLKL